MSVYGTLKQKLKNEKQSQPSNDSKSVVKELEPILTCDLVPELNALLKRIKLSGKLQIKLTVTLTGEAIEQNDKNDLFATDVIKYAKGAMASDIKEYIANMAKVLQAADAANDPVDRVQKVFEMHCIAVGKELSLKLPNVIAQHIESNKAIKKAYRKYQVRCVNDVISDVAIIAASIALTAASWGTTGPVAVVAIVRTCCEVGRQIHDMAVSAGTVMKEIEIYFDCLDKLVDEADKKSGKLNAAKEAGLAALAGILALPIPSVEEIERMMELLNSKLQGIHTTRIESGAEMAKLRNEIDAYWKKIEENKKSADFDPDKVSKHVDKIGEFRKVRNQLAVAAEEMYLQVKEAIPRQKEYEEKLELYKKNQKSWASDSGLASGVATALGKTKLVFGMATTLGLAGGAGSSGLEKAMVAIAEALRVAEDQLEEKL